MLIEAGRAVPWTKPEDLQYDADGPVPSIGGVFTEDSWWRKKKSGYHVLMVDGGVQWKKRDWRESELRAGLGWRRK